jgi:DNA adenine methylase
MSDSTKALPLYRWVGGKRKILNKILPHIPKKFETYFEPFFGGGALFFALSPQRAIIGDANPEVVNFLTVLRDRPFHLLRALSRMTNSADAYYTVRGSAPESPTQ